MVFSLKKKPKAQIESTEHVGTFEGVKVYAFKSADLLPTKRYLYFLANNNDAELGITRNDLRAFVAGIRKCVNGKDFSRIGWYIETINFYLEEYNPERMLFKSGAVMLMLEDEDPFQIEDKHMKRKAELFDTNEEFRAFFLRYTFRVLKSYGILSDGFSEEDFTNLSRSRSERIYSKLTGKDLYWDYLSG